MTTLDVTAPAGQAAAPAGFKIIPLCFAVDYIIVNQASSRFVDDLLHESSGGGRADR